MQMVFYDGNGNAQKKYILSKLPKRETIFLQKNTCRELFNKFSFFSKNVNFFSKYFFLPFGEKYLPL